jgi:hypothetical protein
VFHLILLTVDQGNLAFEVLAPFVFPSVNAQE